MFQPFKFFLLFMYLLTLFSCYDETDKSRYDTTTEVCDGSLFVETYIVYDGGVYGGQTYADYLTDSTNFNVFIGTYDDDEILSYKCQGDSIYISFASINHYFETSVKYK